jgi:NAD(P)-dependent dehydrogenase (short-subunit alcohol dehydrogenase family)
MQLAGSTAIVTGGASGLGATTAKLFSEGGARVALLDLNEEAARDVAASLDGFGTGCDVTDEASVVTALEAVAVRLGPARILVNCAGIAPAARIVGRKGPHSLADFRRVLDINLTGSFNVMRLFAEQAQQLDALEDGELAVIVNTASVAAFEGQIGQAAYAASKGGIAALTLPAAREFAAIGIRVNAIAPGTFETPMLGAMPDEVRESLAAAVPFPSRLGRPAEYAALAAHIVENAYINGAVLRLDGALRMASR